MQRALTHRSWAHENPGTEHNERLEFLGDSVLGQAVACHLYKTRPHHDEGQLSRGRAALVSTVALAGIARRIKLGQHIRLGKGAQNNKSHDSDSILADTLEAVIAAVYLLKGQQEAAKFILELVLPILDERHEKPGVLDPKTTLQELAEQAGKKRPNYEIEYTGPAHNRVFTATVRLLGHSATGSAGTKKQAEAAAARNLVKKINNKN